MSLIVARAPFRISFAGGGTDLPSFYLRERGAVLSTTIKRFVYIVINRREPYFGQGVNLSCSPHAFFPHRIRVSYSTTENVESPQEIRHPIVREALLFLGIEESLDINSIADIPAGTGLGSSSTFAVALLHALHEFRGDRVGPDQLAREAAHIELEILKRPIGKQDHYAAAFGGLNLIEFHPEGDVKIQPFERNALIQKQLFPHLMLLYTKMSRPSHEILEEQSANTHLHFKSLCLMRDHAYELERLARNGLDPASFGRILHESWSCKRRLASGVTSDQIDGWYEKAVDAGAWGGKICGAGGGGFLLLVVPPERRQQVRNALQELPEMPIEFEGRGSQILVS